jgi:hypothetical protein
MKLGTPIIIFCLTILCFCSCTKNNTPDSIAKQKTDFICSAGDLQFDEVEAYTISYEDLQVIENRKPQSDNDKLLDRIVSYYPIDNLKEADSAMLVRVGFTPKNINKEDYQYLCNLFQEKYVYEDTLACQAVFRDILLFKEKQKLTGLAKVCYSCGHSVVFFGDSLRNVNAYRLDALLNSVSQTVR